MEETQTKTPQEQEFEAQQEKIRKLAKALNLDRMNEDVSLLREEVHTVSKNLNALVEALQQARAQQPAQAQSQQPQDDIPPEQKMLLIKDLFVGASDLIRSWKGTGAQPQGNAYGDIIMQSLARAFQVHVDDIVYGTLNRLPPEAQNKYFTPTPPANPVRTGFEK